MGDRMPPTTLFALEIQACCFKVPPGLTSHYLHTLRELLIEMAAAVATPSADTLQSILATAKLAASKAGELIMANKGAVAVAHTKDGDKDLVTLIDKQCEEVRIPQE